MFWAGTVATRQTGGRSGGRKRRVAAVPAFAGRLISALLTTEATVSGP